MTVGQARSVWLLKSVETLWEQRWPPAALSLSESESREDKHTAEKQRPLVLLWILTANPYSGIYSKPWRVGSCSDCLSPSGVSFPLWRLHQKLKINNSITPHYSSLKQADTVFSQVQPLNFQSTPRLCLWSESGCCCVYSHVFAFLKTNIGYNFTECKENIILYSLCVIPC